MAQQAARIVRDDEVMGGEPRIEGRRITVLRIRALVEERGLSAAEVAEMHDLEIVDVYAALTYFYEHPDEMERVREQRSDHETEAREAGAKTIAELRAEQSDEEKSA